MQSPHRGIRWVRTSARLALGSTLLVATAASAVGAATTSDPTTGAAPSPSDLGSLSAITQMVGAQNMWAKGYTGKGVGVALIDTGVTKVPGLDQGQVIDGPDFSFDSQTATLAHQDGYGHGTHMASIIAGHDAVSTATTCSTCLNSSRYSDTTKFVGVAPDAKLINIKVGANNDANDVSQIVAAIDWAVAHRNDTGLNIRVINLSYGTNSSQLRTHDPVAFAAENAWRHGVVVVAAAGNDGDTNTTSLGDPAYDGVLLAAGADDPNGTQAASDDIIPTWAQHGNAVRGVDLVAPGVHVLGLRVPGSQIDVANPSAVVNGRYFHGSGTSQAAAVISGTAALLLQEYPTATPDQVKAMLRNSASTFGSATDLQSLARGRGRVQVDKATSASNTDSLQAVVESVVALGDGTLDGARGGQYLTDNGVALTGEIDIFGKAWVASTYVPASTNLTVWNGTSWRGTLWNGTWQATDWAGKAWVTTTTNPSWDGSRWSGSRWSGSRWKGSRWSGSRWSDYAWN